MLHSGEGKGGDVLNACMSNESCAENICSCSESGDFFLTDAVYSFPDKVCTTKKAKAFSKNNSDLVMMDAVCWP